MAKKEGETGSVEAEPIETVKHQNIFEALSAFQGELKPLKRSGHVQFETKSGKVDFRYTPLSEVMEAIYPLLAKHGLSVRHEIVRGGTLGTREGIEAILTHGSYKHDIKLATSTMVGTDPESNENLKELKYEEHVENELRSGVVFISQGSDMKDVGSAITYARRYTLTMLLGIASEDDNDVKLLEERGASAIAFAYTKAANGIRDAKTVEDVEKAERILKDDLKKLEGGKAGALGLSKEQYEELLKSAGERKTALGE